MKRILITAAALSLLVMTAAWAGPGAGGLQGKPVRSGTGFGTITDGDAVFSWAGFGMVNADNAHFFHGVDPTDHMFENSWYFRVDGDADETVWPAPDTENYSGNVATLGWNDVGGRGLFSAELVSTVVEGGGGGVAQLTHVMTISPFIVNGVGGQLNVFGYLDMDLANTAGDDQGVLISDPDLMEDFDPTTLFQNAGPGAIEFKVTNTQQPTGSLRSLFMDGLPTDLDGLGLPFGPGDMDAAYQWEVTLDGVGGGVQITRVETLIDKNVPVELLQFEIE